MIWSASSFRQVGARTLTESQMNTANRVQDRKPPLVSVGIPTFNRLIMLRRAVDSALSQDYPNLEVVISDNASTDGTQAWCEQLARRDSRVRYVRQPNTRDAGAYNTAHSQILPAFSSCRAAACTWYWETTIGSNRRMFRGARKCCSRTPRRRPCAEHLACFEMISSSTRAAG